MRAAATAYNAVIDFAQRISLCHTADLAAFVPWHVAGRPVGYVHRERLPLLLAICPEFRTMSGGLELVGDDAAVRSAAMASCVQRLVQRGELRPPLGELYPVRSSSDLLPRLVIDRTAVAWFGVRAAGVHLNGIVRRSGALHLWVARRARDKRSYPSHLDNLVAGGAAWPLSPRETLVKECAEEAALPAPLAAQARDVGALHYVMQDGLSLKPDRLDLFDLELPADFVPRAVDGEVEAFDCWSAARVVASLRSDEAWKPNCALVVIDCLLRHGALDDLVPPAQRWDWWRRLRG